MSEKFTCSVPVRFRDLDPLNHVNNAVYASYLEEARTAYIEEVLGIEIADNRFVIANLEIDYRKPITLGDDPAVALWITDLGTSSATVAYEFRVDGEAVAEAETTLVHIDPDSTKPEPFPHDLRERILEAESHLRATA
ncbi:acyl-CoA thioesterase [Natrialbaceae archaeon GCM10025810]|uniref:acyl-CoA thioesterase n=1 Tax=Halovalidus salilacus TaxID=3075124 RepID=UPI0036133190